MDFKTCGNTTSAYILLDLRERRTIYDQRTDTRLTIDQLIARRLHAYSYPSDY